MIVWRNKKKQFDIQAGGEPDDDKPDAMVVCDKQRNGEWEGRVALWFDSDSQQFLGAAKATPQVYVR
jgi:twinkle protein